jgi:probable F420-dependent oxidoreductase
MHIAITVRNMGPQSSLGILSECAREAETAGFESLWITDHIAIPPEDSEGSNGRYLDPLVTLGFLAGITRRIKLGTGVLILPYRPALPTAKQIATLQELSAGRLLLGAGIGWMDAEFRALGLDRRQRGADSDAVLEFLNRCFASDTVSANGQEFLFRPKPGRPPIYIGGAAKNALPRAVAHDAGWMPMGIEPHRLAGDIEHYHQLCAEADSKPRGITVLRGLPLEDRQSALEIVDGYRQLGVERLVCACRYDNAEEFSIQAAALAELLF